MTSIAVSKVVNVNILTSPTFPKRKGFGLLNIIGNSARLPIVERMRFYSDMDDVAADFSTTDEEYKAAQVFFSQAPRPTELAISRRFSSAVSAELLGGINVAALSAFQAITTGGLTITIDGTARVVANADFSAAGNMNAVAAVVQAKLAALAAGTTVVWTGTKFKVSSPTTGPTSTLSFATAAAGVNLAPLMGLDAASLGSTTDGQAAETIAGSLDAIQNYDSSWYGFMFTSEATEQNLKDAMAWAQARVKLFGFTTSASNVLDISSNVDIGSFAKQNLYSRTIWTWDNNDPYQIASVFARGFAVNFNESDSTITLKFKTLPGTTPVSITESQRQALVAKNGNYYTYFGDSAMLAEGVMASGQFFDERHGLDWLQNAVETNVFGYLYTRTTKVPQTDKGVASLVQQVQIACDEAVRNGLLAPGQWNGMDLGTVKSGEYLPKGYYIYAQKVAEQNQSDREARKSPPIQGLLKGAGAIHSVDVTLTFER